MSNILLADFGSTYTKLTAVNTDSLSVLGTASAYTTVQTDINEGFKNALGVLRQKTGDVAFDKSLACSSAAGGLRMITCGLVPELTGQAAKLTSLGAGAKNIGFYSFKLTDKDTEDIVRKKPDIFLLVGGTDGGNTDCILHNARMLAKAKADFPIIIAGNKCASEECKEILRDFDVYVCPNVMPKFGVLQTEPTQQQIRDIFLAKIIRAKGLNKLKSLFSDIIMPTPSAVLSAMKLLSEGYGDEKGIGELIGIDVGGATTDIYSIADGMPSAMNTVYKGLAEPYAKRTVEGDIGMRYSIDGILAISGEKKIAELARLPLVRVLDMIDHLRSNPDRVPRDSDELEQLDFALASCAVEEATKRHAGTLTETYTMLGKTFVQEGKNLTGVRSLVVTGGSLIHTRQTARIASNALYSPSAPNSLRPEKADVWVDRRYILAAMGLLATEYPQAALKIMKKELEYNGHSE